MMRLAPATGWDIRSILKGLSSQNTAERLVLGLAPEELQRRLTDLAAGGHSEIAMHEGAPIAAFGVNESPDGYNETWFIATDRFFAMGVSGLRYARTRLKYYRERYEKPLRSISLSPVAEAPKWFKALGFVEVAGVDGCRVFVYR